jgi:hypothetical protein
MESPRVQGGISAPKMMDCVPLMGSHAWDIVRSPHPTRHPSQIQGRKITRANNRMTCAMKVVTSKLHLGHCEVPAPQEVPQLGRARLSGHVTSADHPHVGKRLANGVLSQHDAPDGALGCGDYDDSPLPGGGEYVDQGALGGREVTTAVELDDERLDRRTFCLVGR